MKTYAGKTVWIIGASSGIGHALARELHRRGAALVLSARNEAALRSLANSLGRDHTVLPLDVTDQASFKAAVESLETIDSVVYLPAAYKPGSCADMTAENVSDALRINLEGAFTLIRSIIPYYKKLGRGQIALCGSVAGYNGLPYGQPYSATKAAIINLAQSLRTELKGNNIDVKLISPGFVKTPLTAQNTFSMPMIVEPEQAAHHIAEGLLKRGFEVHFPKSLTFGMKLLGHLPYALFFKITGKMMPKS